MKNFIHITLISLCAFTTTINAKETEVDVYINQNVGFNVEGYDYKQPALPCDIDKSLVDFVVEKSKSADIHMQAVTSKDKVQNGIIPVVLIDIEQLVLGDEHNYGESTNSNLPKIQITAGVLKGKAIQTAKHTCAIASTANNLLLPTDKITYHIPPGSVCAEAQKCLKDLSKDVVEWLKPQVK